MNIHGNYMRLESAVGCRAELGIQHHAYHGYFPYRVGEKVEFSRGKGPEKVVLGRAVVAEFPKPGREAARPVGDHRAGTMKDGKAISLSGLHEEERILVTAHRGDSLECPENTLISMERAVEVGADFIEFDLRATRENVPILLHDPTLKRTAGAEGRPEDKSLAEIKSLNASWFRHMHRMDAPLPEKVEIPTFEEVLAALSGKVAMNIQIYLSSPAALAEACRLYRKYDMYDTGYFTIEDEKVIEAVRAIDRDVAICFTPGWLERAEEVNLRRCAELGCRFFQPVRETLTAEKLALARSLGLRANAFYADTEIDFEFLLGVGCPGIMTDAPARLVNWLGLIGNGCHQSVIPKRFTPATP